MSDLKDVPWSRRDARVNVFCGVGRFDFRLDIDALQDLDETLKAGPAELFNRLQQGRWRERDISEILRNGLIGAGMARSDAHALTVRIVKPGYLAECVPIASAIVAAAIFGVEEELGERPGAQATATTTKKPKAKKPKAQGRAASTSPRSTRPRARSASRGVK